MAASVSARVTLTGTGVPPPRTRRAGAGALVEVDGLRLQFDAGRATALRLAEVGVGAEDLDALFLTHHHSDHCLDVDDLVMTRWRRRRPPFPVIAPDGPLTRFGERLLDPWSEDIDVRRAKTGRPPIVLDWRTFPSTARPTRVWSLGRVVVSAVQVEHAPVEPAVAYRVEAPDLSIVISGDTRVCEAVESLSHGADLLVHEAALADNSGGEDSSLFDYHADARDLGALARRARVRTLVLTHLMPPPRGARDVRAFRAAVRAGGFKGRLFVGRDLLRVAPRRRG